MFLRGLICSLWQTLLKLDNSSFTIRSSSQTTTPSTQKQQPELCSRSIRTRHRIVFKCFLSLWRVSGFWMHLVLCAWVKVLSRLCGACALTCNLQSPSAPVLVLSSSHRHAQTPASSVAGPCPSTCSPSRHKIPLHLCLDTGTYKLFAGAASQRRG